MRLRGASIRECVAFIWLRGRVHDSRKGPLSAQSQAAGSRCLPAVTDTSAQPLKLQNTI